MIKQRRILVIGAGASGLGAIKSCKEELLDVVCYEKTKNYGGRWRFTEQYIPRTASIMKSTVCLFSKEMEAYSDFPPPSDFPNFLHNTKMLQYLSLYVQKFDLEPHLTYQREVIRMIPSPTYDKDGKWSVTSINKYNNSETTEEFDGVMVCTGRLSESVFPSFTDQNLFSGIVLHSQNLKTPKDFEDLRVLVVGSGNSAVDVAVEISTVAQQVYLSTRKGFWLFPKLGPKGLPHDMQLFRRDIHWMKNVSNDFINKYVEGYLETKINHEACKIKPSCRALDKIPTVNDDLPDKILTGRVIIKGSVSRFEKNGVTFEHEDSVTELDAVILATGYNMKLPFFEENVYINKNSSSLYKYVFPVKMKHPSLAFIGFIKSNGPQVPIAESQSRWAARLFSSKINLPLKETMEAYISTKSHENKNSNDNTVDYINYMDELAEEYGTKPNLCLLLFKDYQLFWACFTGPLLSYQYRLVGPNKLENARDLILKCQERVKNSFNIKASNNYFL